MIPDFSGRTAILGGTFNPVHSGHLRLALEVAEGLRLARVELTPCAVPPHKAAEGLLPFELREAFLRAALENPPSTDGPHIAISTLEAELPPPSYTANLLTAWAELRGEPPLFVLGDEDFACLHSWRDGLSLPDMADFAVVPRSGTGSRLFVETVSRRWPDLHPEPFTPVPNAQFVRFASGRACVYLPLPRLDISASQVRKHWCLGQNPRYLVPDAVLRLMHAHKMELCRAWQCDPGTDSFFR